MSGQRRVLRLPLFLGLREIGFVTNDMYMTAGQFQLGAAFSAVAAIIIGQEDLIRIPI